MSHTTGLILLPSPLTMGSTSELAHVKQLANLRGHTPVYGETEWNNHYLLDLCDNQSYQTNKSTETDPSEQLVRHSLRVAHMMKDGGITAPQEYEKLMMEKMMMMMIAKLSSEVPLINVITMTIILMMIIMITMIIITYLMLKN